jgi:hypothetical protein
LALLGDQLLAQSAIDRFSSAAFELVIDGESYRDRQKPATGTARRLTNPQPSRPTDDACQHMLTGIVASP